MVKQEELLIETEWTDEEIEEWIEKRFGPKSLFNRQVVKDLTNEANRRICLKMLFKKWGFNSEEEC